MDKEIRHARFAWRISLFTVAWSTFWMLYLYYRAQYAEGLAFWVDLTVGTFHGLLLSCMRPLMADIRDFLNENQ